MLSTAPEQADFFRESAFPDKMRSSVLFDAIINKARNDRQPARHIPLNGFQQMMLKWDRLHPYNAVHAVTLPGRSDIAALRRAIVGACSVVGIGQLVLDRKHRSCCYHPIDDVRISQLSFSEAPARALESAIGEELDKPFPAGPHYPLRWTVLDDDLNDEHNVVLGYHHVVADAYSIMSLLDVVFQQYLKGLSPGNIAGLTTAPSDDVISLHRRALHIGHVLSLARAVNQYFQLRHAHRMHEDRSGCRETAFLCRSAPDGLVDRLRNVCKTEGAGLNDALLAAVAIAFAHSTPARRSHPRRRKIALATVLSRRKKASQNLGEFFGVCLREAVVLIDRPDAEMRDVLSQVVRQTSRIKTAKAAGGLAWRFQFVKYLWPMLRIPDCEASYNKVFPLCAGVSTVSIDAAGFGGSMGSLRRYIRACPPGPAMPIILAPTICAGRLELGLVFRPTCISSVQADELLGVVVDQLVQFAA